MRNRKARGNRRGWSEGGGLRCEPFATPSGTLFSTRSNSRYLCYTGKTM